MQRHAYTINDVIQTGNAYYGPIKHIVAQLGMIEWRFPFLAQVAFIAPHKFFSDDKKSFN